MIINLTQHAAQVAQVVVGVCDDLPSETLTALLTIQIGGELGLAANLAAAPDFLRARAQEIVRLFVMPHLENAAAEIFYSLGDGDYPRSPRECWKALRPEVSGRGIFAMIGGFCPLMDHLKRELRAVGVTPLEAMSDRVSKEVTLPDGSVRKTVEFQHLGFIESQDK